VSEQVRAWTFCRRPGKVLYQATNGYCSSPPLATLPECQMKQTPTRS